MRYTLTLKEIKARLALERQKKIVQGVNEKLISSIDYAQRIQKSILGSPNEIDSWFKDSFVLFSPKDKLSGDFYWFYNDPKRDLKIIIASDCTGHGVPAALTTVLGISLLKEIIIQKKIHEPHRILERLDKAIIKSFASTEVQTNTVDDGMDISVLVFKGDKVFFSGAKNPLYVINNNEVQVFRGSRFPIGSTQYSQKVFKTEVLKFEKGSKLYLFSDGFQDQMGGKKDTKFLRKRFREYLAKISHLSMNEQYKLLNNVFEEWRGDTVQTDDVLVIGIEV